MPFDFVRECLTVVVIKLFGDCRLLFCQVLKFTRIISVFEMENENTNDMAIAMYLSDIYSHIDVRLIILRPLTELACVRLFCVTSAPRMWD